MPLGPNSIPHNVPQRKATLAKPEMDSPLPTMAPIFASPFSPATLGSSSSRKSIPAILLTAHDGKEYLKWRLAVEEGLQTAH